MALNVRRTSSAFILRAHNFVEPLNRRELISWLVFLLIASQALRVLSTSQGANFWEILGGQNYIFWFACFVGINRMWSSADRRVSRNEAYAAIILILATFLCSLIAYRLAVGLLSAFLAIYLVCRQEPSLKAAGAVFSAISLHLVWAPLIFQILTPELLYADAALVSIMLKAFSVSTWWSGTTFHTSTGFAISLVGGCSSFHNLSTAALASVSITMYARTSWAIRDVWRLLVTCALMIGLNDLHISLMAGGVENYEFWHNGSGAAIFNFLITAVLLLAALYGSRPDFAHK